jgi:hypothetical protein
MTAKSTLWLLLFLACFACTAPIKKRYNPNSLEEDVEKLISSNALDVEEAIELKLFIVRKNLSDSRSVYPTYEELWQEAQAFQRERNKHLKKEEEAKIHRQAVLSKTQEKRRNTLMLRVISKDQQTQENQLYIVLSCRAYNTSLRDIRAFKGKLVFKDLFDEEITSQHLYKNQSIAVRDSSDVVVKLPYNPFLIGHQQLVEIPLLHLQISWEPEKIIFDNHSTL